MKRNVILVMMAILLTVGATAARGEMPDGIWVRIIPFGEASRPGWGLKRHNGQDVLRMIAALKPDVLDRFIAGKPKVDFQVPMGRGYPPMSLVRYLNAAMKAGAPGCILAPKVHLNKISVWTDDYRMQAAKSLYDLPVTPPIRALSLDCWFSDGNAETQKQRLQQFKDMGWTDLGFNIAARLNIREHASFGMVLINPNGWKVEPNRLDVLKKKGIKTRLLHIDYPNQIREFGDLPPDRQADVIAKEIRPAQRKYGFRFIYPILYCGYDSTGIVTSKDGPYKGATLFEVMKQMIEKDRKELK